jgi:hypothetical protein
MVSGRLLIQKLRRRFKGTAKAKRGMQGETSDLIAR